MLKLNFREVAGTFFFFTKFQWFAGCYRKEGRELKVKAITVVI